MDVANSTKCNCIFTVRVRYVRALFWEGTYDCTLHDFTYIIMLLLWAVWVSRKLFRTFVDRQTDRRGDRQLLVYVNINSTNVVITHVFVQVFSVSVLMCRILCPTLLFWFVF